MFSSAWKDTRRENHKLVQTPPPLTPPPLTPFPLTPPLWPHSCSTSLSGLIPVLPLLSGLIPVLPLLSGLIPKNKNGGGLGTRIDSPVCELQALLSWVGPGNEANN